jgi:hypothetical protein
MELPFVTTHVVSIDATLTPLLAVAVCGVQFSLALDGVGGAGVEGVVLELWPQPTTMKLSSKIQTALRPKRTILE